MAAGVLAPLLGPSAIPAAGAMILGCAIYTPCREGAGQVFSDFLTIEEAEDLSEDDERQVEMARALADPTNGFRDKADAAREILGGEADPEAEAQLIDDTVGTVARSLGPTLSDSELSVESKERSISASTTIGNAARGTLYELANNRGLQRESTDIHLRNIRQANDLIGKAVQSYRGRQR
jgi:hypothetical protein